MNTFHRKGFLFLILSIVSAVGAGTDATLLERAQKGEAEAQFQLGEEYAKGAGIGKDYAEAVRWWRKAADLNFPDAQFSLGMSYVTGQGVPRDLVRAHVWLNIAGAKGVEDARKKVAAIEAEMTADQKAEAMKRATELFEKLAKMEELLKVEAHAKATVETGVDSKSAPIIQGTPSSSAMADRNRPPPRPVLGQRSRWPAILGANQLGNKNIGMAAVDARWSNYGVYLQRMMETVQMQFDALVGEGQNRPKPGTQVSVKFKINSEGTISSIVHVDGGMAGPQAEGYCVSAITKSSPYGKWSDDMVAMLGTEQEMTFVFYYQ